MIYPLPPAAAPFLTPACGRGVTQSVTESGQHRELRTRRRSARCVSQHPESFRAGLAFIAECSRDPGTAGADRRIDHRTHRRRPAGPIRLRRPAGPAPFAGASVHDPITLRPCDATVRECPEIAATTGADRRIFPRADCRPAGRQRPRAGPRRRRLLDDAGRKQYSTGGQEQPAPDIRPSERIGHGVLPDDCHQASQRESVRIATPTAGTHRIS